MKRSVKFLISFICILLLEVLCLHFLFTRKVGQFAPLETLGKILANLPGFLMLIIIALLVAFLVTRKKHSGLASIKNQEAGDGQFGTSRFLTDKEKMQQYIREDFGKECHSGIVVGSDDKGVLIDYSDSNVLLIAPPDSGKTKSIAMPTLFHNLDVVQKNKDKAASIITTDVKGELYVQTSQAFKENGYDVYRLDFRNVLESVGYNFMYLVNKYTDVAKACLDKVGQIAPQSPEEKKQRDELNEEAMHAESLAERYAKILANMINGELDSQSGGGDGSSKFFDTTSKGLMTSLILIVAKYGYQGERHIFSVFNLILELNGLIEGSSEVNQQNRLEAIFNLFPAKERAEYFAGAAVKADVRTSMNVFASAISKLTEFLDKEIEQLITCDENELDILDFVQNPSIIYLVIPDEDPTRHFMGSLFIRNFVNELIEYAQTFKPTQRLPRDVIVLADEFGQFPKIAYFDQVLSAARSRGIRFMIVIQSFYQLELRYGKTVASLIRAVCQVIIFFAIAPSDNATKKELSDMLGSFTTRTGSTSNSTTSNSINATVGTSEQLSKRELLDPSEIGRLPRGTIIVQKYGINPMRNTVKMASTIDYWKKYFVGEYETPKKPIKLITYLAEGKLSVRVRQHKEIRPVRYMYEDYYPSIPNSLKQQEKEEVGQIAPPKLKRLMTMLSIIKNDTVRVDIIKLLENQEYQKLVVYFKENESLIDEKFVLQANKILEEEGVI